MGGSKCRTVFKFEYFLYYSDYSYLAQNSKPNYKKLKKYSKLSNSKIKHHIYYDNLEERSACIINTTRNPFEQPIE